RSWTEAVVALRTLSAAEFCAVVEAMEGYLRELIRQRRGRPREDLLSVLVHSRDCGDALTEAELVSLGVTLLAGGYESAASQLANSVYLLLTHPELWRRLLADPDGLRWPVEELLRMVPLNGGAGLPRVATEDVRLGGVTMRAGEAVFVSTISANRDECAF